MTDDHYHYIDEAIEHGDVIRRAELQYAETLNDV